MENTTLPRQGYPPQARQGRAYAPHMHQKAWPCRACVHNKKEKPLFATITAIYFGRLTHRLPIYFCYKMQYIVDIKKDIYYTMQYKERAHEKQKNENRTHRM